MFLANNAILYLVTAICKSRQILYTERANYTLQAFYIWIYHDENLSKVNYHTSVFTN